MSVIFYGKIQKKDTLYQEIITGHPAAMPLEPVRRRSSSIPLSIVNKKLAVSPYKMLTEMYFWVRKYALII